MQSFHNNYHDSTILLHTDDIRITHFPNYMIPECHSRIQIDVSITEAAITRLYMTLGQFLRLPHLPTHTIYTFPPDRRLQFDLTEPSVLVRRDNTLCQFPHTREVHHFNIPQPPDTTQYILHLSAPYADGHLVWMRDILFRYVSFYWPHSSFHHPLPNPNHQLPHSTTFDPYAGHRILGRTLPTDSNIEFEDPPASPVTIPRIGLILPPSPDSTIEEIFLVSDSDDE